MLKKIYVSSFIFSLSLAMTAYVNSTFITEYINANIVGLLYSLSAISTLVGLEILPKIIAKIGNRKSIFFILSIALLALVVLSNAKTPAVLALAFILYNSASTLTWYSLDIFVEHFSTDTNIGKIRGLYLSITNLAWVFSPFLAGWIIGAFGYQKLYGIIFILLAILFIVIAIFFRNYKDSPYRKITGIEALEYIYKHKDIARIMLVNFTLQFFFSWMVIYSPIYLHEVLGIDFKTIGIMFMIMLTPFVLLEYPLGKIADKSFNEKKFIIAGLGIMGLCAIAFGINPYSSVIIITIILFLSRVGASTVEVMSESYFFRRVKDTDTAIISLFRSTSPISYVIAPLIATVILTFTAYTTLFIILGVLVILIALLTFRLNEK